MGRILCCDVFGGTYTCGQARHKYKSEVQFVQFFFVQLKLINFLNIVT